MVDLLRRAWDALYSFKHAYPENWNEDYEQVLKDLRCEDLKLLANKMLDAKKPWVGLTKEEAKEISMANRPYVIDMIAALEARLKEKNG